MEKVYIVMGSDSPEFGDSTWITKVFTDKKSAQAYCNLQNELEEYYSFYIDEHEISTQDYTSSKIAEYYSYTCDTDFNNLDYYQATEEVPIVTEENKKDILRQLNHPDNRFCNDDETIKRVYDEDLHVEQNIFPTYTNITVYSVNSAQEAKQKALELWEPYYKQWEQDNNI